MSQTNASVSGETILILGGSYGGISVAHYLLKHVISAQDRTYQIVMVCASLQAMCRPACPRALISNDMFPQDKLFVDIQAAFQQYPRSSFRFVHGTATQLDHSRRIVTVTLADNAAERVPFHALIIATGASTLSPLLGLNVNGEYLHECWAAFRKALPAARSIVIAGGGPAGVETAGELGEFLNGRQARWFGSGGRLASPKVQISLVTAGSALLPILRPAIGRTAEKYLAEVGVTVIKNVRVTTVTPSHAGTVSVATPAAITLEDGKVLNADLYIPATGTKPNTGFIEKDLLMPDGRVETNSSTLRVDRAGPRIYAIGDVASYARPAIHLILNAVPVLCANIKRDLLLASGKEVGFVPQDRIFKEDVRETQMVPIGKSKAVGAAMGFRLPSFLVWLIKGRDYWLWTTGGLWSGKQWTKES